MEKSPPNLAEYLDGLRCPECNLELHVEAAAIARLIRAAKAVYETPIPMPTSAAYEQWVEINLELGRAIKEVEVWEIVTE
jgi:hypothetical protein